MTLREWTAIVSITIVVIGTAWYIALALLEIKVKPVLAAWIVSFVGTTLSFLTYWTSPKHSIVSNAYNFASILTIGAIMVTAFVLVRRGNKTLSFSPFQKQCLASAAAIMVLWVVIVWGFKGTGILPNILTNVMMLVGYFVTAEKLYKATENTESLFAWWCIILASLAGLTTGIISKDPLAILFSGRTLFGSVVLVTLMYRLERRTNGSVVVTV